MVIDFNTNNFLKDCDHEATRDIIKSYKEVTYMRQPNQSYIHEGEERYQGYYRIARHYKWALNKTFSTGFKYLIIVEGKSNFYVWKR